MNPSFLVILDQPQPLYGPPRVAAFEGCEPLLDLSENLIKVREIRRWEKGQWRRVGFLYVRASDPNQWSVNLCPDF